MQFTNTDFEETKKVADLIKFCDTADNATLEKVTDQIYVHQPFVLSLFLGYKDEVDIFQLDEVLHILIIIWLFFRDRKNVRQNRITQKMFEGREKKNMAFLQYLEGEPDKQKDQILEGNLGALQSKALFTMVLFKFKEGPALKKLDPKLSGIMLIGMKSLIECFEQISKPKRRRVFRR